MEYKIEVNQYNGIDNNTVYYLKSTDDNCVLSDSTKQLFIGGDVGEALLELKSKIPDIDVVEQGIPTINIDSNGLITATSVQEEGVVSGGIEKVETQLQTANSPSLSAEISSNGLITATSVQDSGFIGNIIDKQITEQIPLVNQATPTISINNSGLITASSSQTNGYISSGTKTATKQLNTKGATTYTPTTYSQTISSGVYLTGTQTIQGDSNLIPSNIKNGVSIFGVTGTMNVESSFLVDSIAINITNNFSDNYTTLKPKIVCFYLTTSKSGNQWKFGEYGPYIYTVGADFGSSYTATIPYPSCLFFKVVGYNVTNYKMGVSLSGGLVQDTIYLNPTTIKFTTKPGSTYAEFTFYELPFSDSDYDKFG